MGKHSAPETPNPLDAIFEYIDDAWGTETEHELLEFAKRVAVISGGLHIQRMAGRGHILWNEREKSWTPLSPGMVIALDDDGLGFHITA